MDYDHGSRPNRRRAATLLDAMKGRLVDASGAVERSMTMQATTASPHWRISNVAGVHVYDVAQGWNADVAFKDLPSGVPAVIGNAVPVKTRREALESAIMQLSLCAEREKVPLAGNDSPMLYFVIDDIEIPVDPDELSETRAKLAHEGYTVEQAEGRLAYLRHVISGDEPLNADNVAEADHETRTRLVIACHIAMALGRTQFSVEDGTWADFMPTAPGMM